MRINLKQCVWVGVLVVGIGITGGAVQVAASAAQEQHEQDNSRNKQYDQDYSKNKNYQQGVREGRNDSAHNRDHYKKRTFKKDEDKKDYETGYQAGHQGNTSDRK
jgi:hypothetical protein